MLAGRGLMQKDRAPHRDTSTTEGGLALRVRNIQG